ncbi:hypothetical protein [Pusillimonas sp. NJUB218]|uniref:hypothetical protein n=1 Tax=Pusillimonas sp. NJUB218 TaxID=2023230 RepID=UPI000F4AFA00|nr:hypothetical protein [Pusillimonas sp. NJUB218]
MTFISNIERYYLQRHIDERKQGWLDEGSAKGAADVLQTLLQQKFGRLPDWASDRIHQANTSTLQRWALNVLSAETLQGVFEQ